MKRSSPLLPIFMIVAVDVLGLTIVLPLLPFYAEKFGASPFVVGMLVASYAACQLVSGPLIGRISDKVGRRPMLLISQVGTLGGFFLLATAHSLWMVFLGRIIDGLTAGNLALAQAYISDVTEPENRARSFGIIGIAFGMGFMIGPAISGFLAGYGYHYPFYAAMALSATSIFATYTLLPRTVPPQHDPAHEAKGEGGPPPPGGQRLALLDWGTYLQFFSRPRLAGLLASSSSSASPSPPSSAASPSSPSAASPGTAIPSPPSRSAGCSATSASSASSCRAACSAAWSSASASHAWSPRGSCRWRWATSCSRCPTAWRCCWSPRPSPLRQRRAAPGHHRPRRAGARRPPRHRRGARSSIMSCRR